MGEVFGEVPMFGDVPVCEIVCLGSEGTGMGDAPMIGEEGVDA